MMDDRPRLHIDIETRSRVDLKKFSVYRYVRDDDFKILMASWSFNGSDTVTALDPDEIFEIPGLWDEDVLKVAHNAQFERICFSTFKKLPVGTYLDPEDFHDTQAIAAEHGYPQKLELLAPALGATPKDTAGTRLINLFCKPNRKGGWNDASTHPLEWLDFINYCEQDVDTLREVDETLGWWPTETERLVYLADQRVNDTGIRIDTEMAELAVEAAEDNRMVQELEISARTGILNPGSVPQMRKWFEETGLKLPNMQAETIERVLAKDDLNDDHRAVLELRQELALVASKKFSTALGSVNSDGRLRGSFRFFGAHTGRWSGSGTQLQNLPRAAFTDDDGDWDEVGENTAILDLMLGEGADSESLKKLVRPLFVGPFTVVDYAAIEARVIAWLAGEEWALQAFRDGRDIYVETAQRMGGLTRAQGKVAVLALGYQGAIKSLRAMGAEGDDEDLMKLVKQWRRANGNIVKLWSTMQEAVGEPGPVGTKLWINRRRDHMQMKLPSGRSIHYHGMKWERYTVEDPETGKRVRKEGWRYDDPKRPGRIGTYGGRLVENATQAVARDILAEALVRLQAAGHQVVGHVHDEILVEGRHDVAEINRIMTEVPSWAKGMPIDGEGFTCERYRKG